MPSGQRVAKRGNLHKLVVCNFKSYAGELTIGPFKDFTCVIGPNGSGKSNLMDAVSFVVGVNTNQLRGTRLADFRSNLESADDRPTSVTLFYHSPTKNGSTDEIQFTRTITVRDTSEYRVDGKKVDEKEYQTRLKNVGLLVKSRNFLVFQNEVEAVAQKSPKQLTELLERISGSEDLKKEYEELSEKKAETAQVSVSVYKRSLLVNNEKKQVKEQVKEATTYQELQQKEADISTHGYLFDIYHLESKLKMCANEMDVHTATLNEKEKDVKAINKAVDKEQKVKAEKEKEWAAADKSVEDIEKSIKKIQQKEIFQVDSELKMRRADMERIAKELSEAQKALKDMQRDSKQDERDLAEITEMLEGHLGEAQKSKDVQLGENQFSKYNKLKQIANAKTYTTEKTVSELDKAYAAEVRELDQAETEVKRTIDRRRTAESKVQDWVASKDKSTKNVEMLTAQEHKYTSEITDIETQMREFSAKKVALTKSQDEFSSKIGDAKADEKTRKGDAQFLEKLSYLSSSFPGVRGRVLDLCKVKQKQYELAITVVMEGMMDAVVVDREETVRRCVEHLRENKLPPMTFLPLDTISAKPPDDMLRRRWANAKLALDVIDYDKAVEKAMWYATGNAVIVEDLEQARAIAYSNSNGPKAKVVTQDACVISKSGTLTGGDTTQLISKSQRWQKQDLEVLMHKYQANDTELQVVSKAMKTQEDNLRGLKNKLMKTKSELEQVKKLLKSSTTECNTYTKEIESYTKTIAVQEPKVEELKKSVKEKKAAVDKARDEILKISDDVFRDFCKEVGIAKISDFEGTTFAEQKERQEKSMEMMKTQAKLRFKVEKGKNDIENVAKRLEDKKKEEKKGTADTDQLKAKEKKSRAAIASKMEEKEEEKRKREAVKVLVDEHDKKLKEIRGVLKAKMEEKEAVEKLLEKEQSTVERLQAQRRTKFEACELEEIDLPRKGRGSAGGEDDDAMDVDESASQKAQEVRKDLMSTSLDYTKLTREQKRDMSDKEQQRVREALEEERKKISDTIASMNPNMKAIEQLKEVEERCNAMQDEIKEARQRATDVNQEFEEVKAQRCALFNSCFEHVKAKIDNTYKELTSDPSKVEHSVGGSAYLTLNNQEEPYLDGIKYDTIPPGKRFMDMTHLSGGEKTVAALALLFAINSYYPAPFIVLDEVDAALDARNVAKVTRFIQSRRTEQQCIIISLKERFYEKADGLVGICRDMAAGHSKVFTLNLTQFESSA